MRTDGTDGVLVALDRVTYSWECALPKNGRPHILVQDYDSATHDQVICEYNYRSGECIRAVVQSAWIASLRIAGNTLFGCTDEGQILTSTYGSLSDWRACDGRVESGGDIVRVYDIGANTGRLYFRRSVGHHGIDAASRGADVVRNVVAPTRFAEVALRSAAGGRGAGDRAVYGVFHVWELAEGLAVLHVLSVPADRSILFVAVTVGRHYLIAPTRLATPGEPWGGWGSCAGIDLISRPRGMRIMFPRHTAFIPFARIDD